MKKTIFFLVSIFSAIYARASDLVVATIPQDQLNFIDDQTLNSLEDLKNAGQLLIEENGNELILILENNSNSTSLIDLLNQRGIVTKRDSVSGSDCDGICKTKISLMDQLANKGRVSKKDSVAGSDSEGICKTR